MDEIVVNVVLTEDQADALAEMAKRLSRDDAKRMSADEAEEKAMIEAVIALRRHWPMRASLLADHRGRLRTPFFRHSPLHCSLQEKGPAVGRGLWSAWKPLGSVEGDQACRNAPGYKATVRQQRLACRCPVAQLLDCSPQALAS
jgi:hypothetical protein